MEDEALTATTQAVGVIERELVEDEEGELDDFEDELAAAGDDEQLTGAVTAPQREAPGDDDGKLHVMYLNHVGQISGAEQSLRSLLWYFRRAGIEIEPDIVLPGTGPLAELLRDEGWNVTFAPLRRLQRPRSIVGGIHTLTHVLKTAPFITRLVRQTRAQLIHSNSTTAHIVGGMAAERTGVPAVWHARDLTPLGRIATSLAARAAAVIAISDCVAERLKQDGVPEEKIHRIYNGLDPDEWNVHERSQVRESLGVGQDTFIFGCVGQLVPWKNHAAFIEAANLLVQEGKCRNARFVIMGGDLWGEHDSYIKELRALVKKYNLQERFNFIPHQPDSVDAISGMDAVVLCSHDEPFGRVLIEAMALEKPVIAYAENGPGEIVTHEHDGLLVPPDEENGMYIAMERILSDADLRRQLSGQARHSVIEKFHIADSGQRVLELYRDIVQ